MATNSEKGQSIIELLIVVLIIFQFLIFSKSLWLKAHKDFYQYTLSKKES